MNPYFGYYGYIRAIEERDHTHFWWVADAVGLLPMTVEKDSVRSGGSPLTLEQLAGRPGIIVCGANDGVPYPVNGFLPDSIKNVRAALKKQDISLKRTALIEAGTNTNPVHSISPGAVIQYLPALQNRAAQRWDIYRRWQQDLVIAAIHANSIPEEMAWRLLPEYWGTLADHFNWHTGNAVLSRYSQGHSAFY